MTNFTLQKEVDMWKHELCGKVCNIKFGDNSSTSGDLFIIKDIVLVRAGFIGCVMDVYNISLNKNIRYKCFRYIVFVNLVKTGIHKEFGLVIEII